MSIIPFSNMNKGCLISFVLIEFLTSKIIFFLLAPPEYVKKGIIVLFSKLLFFKNALTGNETEKFQIGEPTKIISL